MQSAHIPTTPNYDESKKLLEIFFKYFVELYELKLDAYIMFIEGKSEKPGKSVEFCSEKIGQGAGAGLAYFFPTFSTGVKLANLSAKLLGKTIEKKLHDEKVKSILHILECWRNDKPGFRVKLAAAALDLGQSFEMQFMFITFRVGGYREALRLVALDSVNRSFNYYENTDRSIEHVTISESVLLGNSKTETVLGQIDFEFIKTPGFTIYYRNENDEWRTSSLFEKSGVVIDADAVNSRTYYKLKINSRTSKYGYRKLLKCEIAKWSKLCVKYEEEYDLSDSAQFTDYNYKFSVGSDVFCKIENDLLNHVNEKDPKILEKRMKKLLTEMQESILHEMQTLIDAQKIDHNLLADMKEYLTEFNSVILKNSVEMLQLQKQLLEVTNKNQQETVGSFNLASQERQELADANTSQHEETRRQLAEYFDQQNNTGSKASRSFQYKVRDCNLNYVLRYNVSGICIADEINDHFYPVNDSNDSKNPIPIVIISGLGGVGKSEECRQYCKFWWDYHEGEGFDRALLWIDCTTITSFIDTFKAIGFELKIWTNDENVPKTEKEIVKAIYSYFLDRATLFVFDDADEHVQKFLPQSLSLALYENQELPYILITSRTKLWDGEHEGFVEFKKINLGAFTEEEGLNYVKDCLGLSKDETAYDKDVLDLCKMLNYLPLALRQALAYVQAEKRSVGQYAISDYIAEYKVDRKKLLSFGPYKTDEERYSHPVLTTWLITLKKIKNQAGGKEARDILNILAYLLPNAIELHKILGISIADESPVAKNRDLKAGIQLLHKYSMIDLDSDDRVYIHALLQEIIRIQLREASIVWQIAFALCFVSLLFIIVNAFFSFGTKLSWVALTIGFISFLYVVFTSSNTEESTIGKVLDLLRAGKASRDNDTVQHAGQAWCYASNYFKLVYKYYFKNVGIENVDHPKYPIQRYGPLHDTPLHVLSCDHTKCVYNLLWYTNLLAKLPFRDESTFKGSIVNAINDVGITPLHQACHRQMSEIITMLIESGADITAKDKKGFSVLFHTFFGAFAIADKQSPAGRFRIGQTRKVLREYTFHGGIFQMQDQFVFLYPVLFYKLYEKHSNAKIELGAVENLKFGNIPPNLHRAININNVRIADSLIQQGANIEAEDEDRNTPLHLVVIMDNVAATKLLIKQGANIEATNVEGHTPLLVAAHYGSVRMAELLIEQGANIEAKDKHGYTLLDVAVLMGNVRLADLLIKQGANIEAKNVLGLTPLLNAVSLDELVMAELLIKHGANLDAQNVNGGTPLHYAILSSEVVIAELLINHGANVNVADENKSTPLHLATFSGDVDRCEMLITQGAIIEAKDVEGKTPLHQAVHLGKVYMAEYLINRGAHIESVDMKEKTPLHYAILSDKSVMTEFLIKQGANIEAKDVNGDTPLHLAVKGKFLDLTKMLCEHRANAFEKNSNGDSPLHIAVSLNHLYIIHTLLNYVDNIINDIKWTTESTESDDSCLTTIFLLTSGANLGSIRQSEEGKTNLLNFIAGNFDYINIKFIYIAGWGIERKVPLVKQLLESVNGEENIRMLELNP